MSRRLTLALVPIVGALLVAACSPGATPATSNAPASSPGPELTASPIPASAPAATTAAEATAVPTALDPCQLVTADEASALSSASFGTGTEGTTSGGAKTCTYGGATSGVVQVLVAVAPDAATAQADWAQEQADAQNALKQSAPSGVSFTLNLNDTTVAGADRAAVASANMTISGVKVAVSAIYLLKGAVFVTFSDLAVGRDAASAATLEAQAGTTLSRLP
jgi:hypothetical protein